MTAAPTAVRTEVLDGALRVVTPLEFAPPAYFVNHGPMACEALVALGTDPSVVEGWADAFARSLVPAPGPAPSTWPSEDGWETRLGDRTLLPEWLTFFSRAVGEDDWTPVVARWVPRLMPGLGSALYHGVIRTSHAVRAIEAADTPARRHELVWALASWASWFRPGESPGGGRWVPDDAIDAAARGALAYTARPSIMALHGVTGAMAVDLLSAYVSPTDGEAAVAQLAADHDDLYGPGATPWGSEQEGSGDDGEWDRPIVVATASRDPHQVKLVEACLRGGRRSGGAVFLRAARVVTGLG